MYAALQTRAKAPGRLLKPAGSDLPQRGGFCRNPPVQPLDSTARPPAGPKLGHDFSQIRVHRQSGASRATPPSLMSNSRGILPAEADGGFVAGNRRPGEDPVHQGFLDTFRRQQGQPPGGVDAQGNQVGPSDGEIKYRPQPIAVLNGPFHAPIDEPLVIGMEIQITVQSSSGDNADMASVQDSEQVSPSLDHTGSFAGLPPIIGNVSGFMAAVGIPNDRHRVGRAHFTDRADNHGGTGSISFQQLDIYTHPRYAIFNPLVIPNSGYRITQTITAGPGTQLRLRTDKAPEACTVNGFTTTAGPSPAQHDEVLVRA